MTISEDLFLLLTRDDGKPESAFTQASYGYAAANVVDLVLAERVRLSEDKDPRVSVVDASPTGHPALDAALARLGEKDGKKASQLISDGRVAAEDQIVDSLAQAGIIRVEEKRMLGLVPEKRPVLDPSPERALRGRLRAVLHGGSATPQEATVLSILQGLDLAAKVLADEWAGLSKREVKTRIKELAADIRMSEAMSKAVANAVASMNAAIISAVVVSTAVSGSGS
ncbi:GOLPH3/VPS74 family protein [Mobilicoccus massiliensis]|uniref:GOLPH3/VPS74 family protein n=1 Tax=Mobilicoccus massiliensis TaxID=1522310 RepID=UPI00058C21B7|nr:GPP34 family phosphoprotein [Mobilicoccus massiliensis]